MNPDREKHQVALPNLRTIRRACSKELYRTLKRLPSFIPAAAVREAEDLYTRRVVGHLEWIAAHRSNRKKLADWWEEAVCSDIAALWQVDPAQLSRAFRDAFGGSHHR